jgi:hypothetical protein
LAESLYLCFLKTFTQIEEISISTQTMQPTSPHVAEVSKPKGLMSLFCEGLAQNVMGRRLRTAAGKG